MFEKLLFHLAPHHCYYCGDIGTILCDSCIKNIQDEIPVQCLVCLKPSTRQLCYNCRQGEYKEAWFAGFREGQLLKLVDDYKFSRKKEAGVALAKIFDGTLPYLPQETILVPVPTISSHIRVRGYDHILVLSKHLSRTRGYTCKKLIERNTSTTQQGASLSLRLKQAKTTFKIRQGSVIESGRPYLIIDDIYTTGSTVKAAANLLKDAGAKNIMVCTLLRQLPYKNKYVDSGKHS